MALLRVYVSWLKSGICSLDRPATTSQVHISARTSISRNCKPVLLFIIVSTIIISIILLLLLLLLLLFFHLLFWYVLLLMFIVPSKNYVSKPRWLAICVVSHFKLCWLVNVRRTRWLAGSFVSLNSCLLAVKRG